MMATIEAGLKQLGLDDKEAKVYVAALELGPSPVQKIAVRATVPRATTYLVLDALKEKGLVSTYEQGKKTYFVAEPPQKFTDLLAERHAALEQQQKLLTDLIPLLDAHGQYKPGTRPTVRYYECQRAIKTFIQDVLSGKGGDVLNLFNLEQAHHTLEAGGVLIDDVRSRRARFKIKTRAIYTSTKGSRLEKTPDRDAKFVPPEDLPLETDISIRGNKVIFIPYNHPLRGVAIEDPSIAEAMRHIFELIWKSV